MTILMLNIALMLFEAFILLRVLPKQRNKKIFCILATVQWILLSGLRGMSIGADTSTYYTGFFKISEESWSTVFNLESFITRSDTKSPGYRLIVKIFQIFSKDFQLFLIIVAISFFAYMGYSIYKRSSNPLLSFIMFSCLFYSFFAFTGIRQTMATGIMVFVGYEFIRQRRIVPYLILALITIPIHLSVLCFIPFYWIAKIKINVRTLPAIWAVVALSFLLRYQLHSVLRLVTGYNSVNYDVSSTAHAGPFLYLLILVGIIITMFHKKLYSLNPDVLSKSDLKHSRPGRPPIPFVQISMNGIYTACALSSMLLLNMNSMRAVQYYSLSLMYIIPSMLNVFRSKRDKAIVTVVIVIVLLAFLYSNNPAYMFFWQDPFV